MSELSLPEYDQEAFATKYGELSRYQAVVPHDMAALGYSGINKLYSEIQGQINRVDELLAEAVRYCAEAEAVYNASKFAFEAKRDLKISALSKDQFESIKIVEAKVNVELAEDLKLMQRAKLMLGLFKAYRRSVEGKHKNLESAKKTLENQNNNFKRQTPPLPPGTYPVV